MWRWTGAGAPWVPAPVGGPVAQSGLHGGCGPTMQPGTLKADLDLALEGYRPQGRWVSGGKRMLLVTGPQ